jgi:hypothetical protein
MERNSNHLPESSAKCPLRPKEMKFNFGSAISDERFSETTVKSDERRGFRPAPRLHALHLSRGKYHRNTGGAAAAADDASNSNAGRSGSGGEGIGAIPPLTDTPVKDNQLQVGHAAQRAVRRRSLDFALMASPQMRLKAKAHAAGRHFRISETVPTSHARALWVEGNSVLNTEAGAASSALAYLSECVARERQIKEEWEAARFAKVRAFRAVVKVFMISFADTGTDGGSGGAASDPRQTHGKGVTNALAVARCSSVTNALVGTVQSFARAFCSRQLAAARGMLPSATTLFRPATDNTDLALSFSSGIPPSRVSAEDRASDSRSYSTSDALDREEISRLRQLYFDYFDCEAVSISVMTPSGNENSMNNAGSGVAASRPTSGSFMEDVDEFARCASRTM